MKTLSEILFWLLALALFWFGYLLGLVALAAMR